MAFRYQSVQEWDRAAEALGVIIGEAGWITKGETLLGEMRPMGPHRHASPRCQSGKRDYCTCDTCF